MANAISAEARIAGSNLSVVIDNGQILLKEAVFPARPPGFAVLQLVLAGICNTDLELLRGYYNFQGTPGHEFVARVVACDDPRLFNKRVVGEINIACGSCDFCASGLGRHCRNRSVLGIVKHPGAFSEYFTLPEANLHIVADSVTDEQAVFTEPLAAACEILDQVKLEPDSEVAILGDGKLGLLITQVLVAQDVSVTLYGRHKSKLQIARKAGARALLSSNLPKATYPCVIECTGSPEGLTSAIQMTRPRGTIVMKSTIHNQISIDTAPVIVNEISLVGSRCGRFEPALELLGTQKVDLADMMDSEFSLKDAGQAFTQAAKRGTLKVFLRP